MLRDRSPAGSDGAVVDRFAGELLLDDSRWRGVVSCICRSTELLRSDELFLGASDGWPRLLASVERGVLLEVSSDDGDRRAVVLVVRSGELPFSERAAVDGVLIRAAGRSFVRPLTWGFEGREFWGVSPLLFDVRAAVLSGAV